MSQGSCKEGQSGIADCCVSTNHWELMSRAQALRCYPTGRCVSFIFWTPCRRELGTPVTLAPLFSRTAFPCDLREIILSPGFPSYKRLPVIHNFSSSPTSLWAFWIINQVFICMSTYLGPNAVKSLGFYYNVAKDHFSQGPKVTG